MENNEIMLDEEVFEAAEEVAVRPSKALVAAGAVAGVVLVGVVVYKKLIKPAIAKAKAKKKIIADSLSEEDPYAEFVEDDIEVIEN